MRDSCDDEIGHDSDVGGQGHARHDDARCQSGSCREFHDDENPPPVSREADPVQAIADQPRRPNGHHAIRKENERQYPGRPPRIRRQWHVIFLSRK